LTGAATHLPRGGASEDEPLNKTGWRMTKRRSITLPGKNDIHPVRLTCAFARQR
jgi:hypothetical protein